MTVNLVEFDNVTYRLQASAAEPTKLQIHFAVPPERTTTQLPDGALEAVESAYAGIASVMGATEPGFNLSLEISLDAIPKEPEAFEAAVDKLSGIRSVIMGAPLRKHFVTLADGTCKEGALVAVPYRTGEAYFIKPQNDQVTVVFPMRFKDPNDAVMACTFLAEFIEARRSQALTTAPSCSYHKLAPMELKDAPSALTANTNGGFVSFVLFKRHVTGKRLDSAAWRMSSFYAFVNYHIKCSKAFMHTRMRNRTATLLQVLNRAKPEVAKEKKTASGRTFVRKGI